MVTAGATPSEETLVSCILPTKNRAHYIGQAVRSYLSQTYSRLELIILDNGDDDTEAHIPDCMTVIYLKVTGKRTTGEMRNLCVEQARGSIIVHFDSDDWSAPDRVADQVKRLGIGRILTGYSSMYFYDDRDGKAYEWSNGKCRYHLGTSLCYRKAWWEDHPFPLMQVGEDFRFVQTAIRHHDRQVLAVPAGQLMVARIHPGSTSPKNLKSLRYQPVSLSKLPKAFLCA